MGKIKIMKLALANLKNYIFNKNRTLISKELFEQMSDSEFALLLGKMESKYSGVAIGIY